jgi:hypothetical protein
MRLLDTIYARLPGWKDESTFSVSYDHPTCSYGQPVLILSGVDRKFHEEFANSGFGGGDLIEVQIAHTNEHYAALQLAGFNLVEGLSPSEK